MSRKKTTPCPKCGAHDWRYEKRGGYTVRRCRSCSNIRMRARRKRLPHEGLFDGARRRAREAGVPFTLSRNDVHEILADWTCAYCGSPVGSFAGTGSTHPTSATLDRIIPDEGYTCLNTVIACHRCNAAKAEHTPTSLRRWADNIEEVINRKNPTRKVDDQG